MTLQKLKASILADGKIDATEVEQIKKVIYQDGKIDKEEADFLFELNTACSAASNDKSWESLFIEAISSFLLDDTNSPNEIDGEEAKWLISKIGEDGKVDKTEKALLSHLKLKAQKTPQTLTDYFSKYA